MVPQGPSGGAGDRLRVWLEFVEECGECTSLSLLSKRTLGIRVLCVVKAHDNSVLLVRNDTVVTPRSASIEMLQNYTEFEEKDFVNILLFYPIGLSLLGKTSISYSSNRYND